MLYGSIFNVQKIYLSSYFLKTILKSNIISSWTVLGTTQWVKLSKQDYKKFAIYFLNVVLFT